MTHTPEGIYLHGLLSILAEGPVKSAELIEGRPLPDLAGLAGEDERLRGLAERQPSAQVLPDSLRVIEIASRLPDMRWNLLRTKGICQVYNRTPGFPAWYKISVEKFRYRSKGKQRGLRVTAQALDPESAGADVIKMSPFGKLRYGAFLLIIVGAFVILTIGKGGFDKYAWAGAFVPGIAVAIIFFISWAWKRISRSKSEE
jgi:hypothetical protein